MGFLLIPAATVIQFYYLSEKSWRFMGELLSSRFFLEEWLFSWSAAAAVAIVSRGSLAYFIALSGYVLARRFANLTTHPTLETPLSIGITAFWFGVVIAFLISELKIPYLHPKLRWWTRPPRLGISSQAILLYGHLKIPAEVLNISQGGAFVRLPEASSGQGLLPQHLGDEFQFEITLGSSRRPPLERLVFKSKARLVWKASPQSPYRSGMGVEFLGLSRQQRQLLKKYLRRETVS